MAEQDRPTDIRIRKQSGALELTYGDGHTLSIPFELLRVFSPSAEVRGHGASPGPLQTGKRGVLVTGAEMVGNYALRLDFSDGHDTGIFSWAYLRELGEEQAQYWQAYLERLEKEGGLRER
jgi:DUF971 family protein